MAEAKTKPIQEDFYADHLLDQDPDSTVHNPMNQEGVLYWYTNDPYAIMAGSTSDLTKHYKLMQDAHDKTFVIIGSVAVARRLEAERAMHRYMKEKLKDLRPSRGKWFRTATEMEPSELEKLFRQTVVYLAKLGHCKELSV